MMIIFFAESGPGFGPDVTGFVYLLWDNKDNFIFGS